MRYVPIDLSSDSYLQNPQIFGGYAGEHNETVLQVTLPQRMIGIEYSDYRFDFQTSEDNEISVPVTELDNGILSCHLTEQLTIAGKLLFNVVARKLNGDSVSLTSKTNMVILYIGDSPDGNGILPDPNGYKDEMLEIIDARIAKALEGIQTGEGGAIVVDKTYNPESENAQSGIAVKEAISGKMDKFGEVEDITVQDGNTTYERGKRVVIPDYRLLSFGNNYVEVEIDGTGKIKLSAMSLLELITGGHITLNIGGKTITLAHQDDGISISGVATPTFDDAAVNKKYVDDSIANINIPEVDLSSKMDKFGEVTTDNLGNTTIDAPETTLKAQVIDVMTGNFGGIVSRWFTRW